MATLKVNAYPESKSARRVHARACNYEAPPCLLRCLVCLSSPSHLMSGRPAGRHAPGTMFVREFPLRKPTFLILSTPPLWFVITLLALRSLIHVVYRRFLSLYFHSGLLVSIFRRSVVGDLSLYLHSGYKTTPRTYPLPKVRILGGVPPPPACTLVNYT